MEKRKNTCQKIKEGPTEKAKKGELKKWDKPTLEDVSEKVMAQPYIRFT